MVWPRVLATIRERVLKPSVNNARSNEETRFRKLENRTRNIHDPKKRGGRGFVQRRSNKRAASKFIEIFSYFRTDFVLISCALRLRSEYFFVSKRIFVIFTPFLNFNQNAYFSNKLLLIKYCYFSKCHFSTIVKHSPFAFYLFS